MKKRGILVKGHRGTICGETFWRADAVVAVGVRRDGLRTRSHFPLFRVLHVTRCSPS